MANAHSSVNHQPFLAPVAQHGTRGDRVYVSMGSHLASIVETKFIQGEGEALGYGIVGYQLVVDRS